MLNVNAEKRLCGRNSVNPKSLIQRIHYRSGVKDYTSQTVRMQCFLTPDQTVHMFEVANNEAAR